MFLTLCFQSFLLFHFLVLVPQFYPRCNVSGRERQRESEAGQTDEMETHPPKMIRSQAQDYKSRDKKRSSLRGGGLKKIKRPNAFPPGQELNSYPNLHVAVKISQNVRAGRAFNQAPSFWQEETDPTEAGAPAQDQVAQDQFKLPPQHALCQVS